MISQISNSNWTPVRQTAAAESRPAPAEQAPAQADDQAQLIAFVANLTRADAAQVIALTQPDPTRQTYEAVASAYAEFD